MKDIVIEFNHVSKRYKLYKNDRQRFLGLFIKNIKYKTKYAIKDVSFQIEKGDAVAILGKNGAGKSTVLKMITQVCFPTSGQIMVKGRVSALLELTSGFDPEFTGLENIYLKGQLLGLKNEEIKQLEKQIIDFSELEDYIDQPIRTYSSGMRARLGFAINANIRPEILIVDETLSVGDKDFTQKCMEKIDILLNEEKVTLLFVTHSMPMARKFCKKAMVLENGELKTYTDIHNAIEVYQKS